MGLNSISRRAMHRMSWIGMAILIIGVVSFAFGIVLLVSANTMHDEEIAQLEIERSPTSIGELKDLREQLSEYRHLIAEPEDTETFLMDYINIGGLLWNGENTNMDDFKWEGWNNLLSQENGTSIGMLNLGTAEIVSYAGTGTLVFSTGLIVVGLLVIILSPGINQMRKSIAELSKVSQSVSS